VYLYSCVSSVHAVGSSTTVALQQQTGACSERWCVASAVAAAAAAAAAVAARIVAYDCQSEYQIL
jgi:hypothetical protein